jgi:hypothetical protein
MKLFAVAHGGGRREDKDLGDVAYLAVLNELETERDLRPLCDRYASSEVYSELCRRIKNIL